MLTEYQNHWASCKTPLHDVIVYVGSSWCVHGACTAVLILTRLTESGEWNINMCQSDTWAQHINWLTCSFWRWTWLMCHRHCCLSEGYNISCSPISLHVVSWKGVSRSSEMIYEAGKPDISLSSEASPCLGPCFTLRGWILNACVTQGKMLAFLHSLSQFLSFSLQVCIF